MGRFVEGEDRRQSLLLPESLDDYVTEDTPVRVVEAFIDELDLVALGFEGVMPAATGRPAYHPSTLLKIYLYGYLNRIQSSRRLEREAQRNIELIWLTGRLEPDFTTISNFRRENGPAIRAVCAQFIELCRRQAWFDAQLDLDPERLVFIDETWASTKMARTHGRAVRGQRLRMSVPHGHWTRRAAKPKRPPSSPTFGSPAWSRQWSWMGQSTARRSRPMCSSSWSPI